MPLGITHKGNMAALSQVDVAGSTVSSMREFLSSLTRVWAERDRRMSRTEIRIAPSVPFPNQISKSHDALAVRKAILGVKLSPSAL